jgi:hypothetical protein
VESPASSSILHLDSTEAVGKAYESLKATGSIDLGTAVGPRHRIAINWGADHNNAFKRVVSTA